MKLCTDVSVASWITDAEGGWNELALFGPPGFEAYARLRFFPDPAFPGQSLEEARSDVDAQNLPLEVDAIARTCQLLAGETSTPDSCYFAMWEGYGELAGEAASDARIEIPNRSYYLFEGRLSDVGEWGVSGAGESQPAAFIWPADRAWCFACDTDPLWAGIGASKHAVEVLTSSANLDLVAADRNPAGLFYR